MNGSKSTDTDDGIFSYFRIQVDGKPVKLSDPTSKITTFIAPETDQNGTNLTFKLTVTDSGGLKDTADCLVYVTQSSLTQEAKADKLFDVVMNPGFEDGKTWWNFYTNGKGSFEVSSPGYSSINAAKVTTVTGGTNIQLFQYGIPMEPNTDYQLSFNACSSAGHGLSVSILKHVSPYTNYGLFRERIDLTTSWDTYILNFRIKNFSVSVGDVRLMFWFADDAVSGDMFWIDNVVITPLN